MSAPALSFTDSVISGSKLDDSDNDGTTSARRGVMDGTTIMDTPVQPNSPPGAREKSTVDIRGRRATPQPRSTGLPREAGS
ncbi:hypothetical protein NY08_2033 [Rhodococcus sp. B7740]|nr:hypothetical protein NY08_2033 [Rhodococcus sp. B7740]